VTHALLGTSGGCNVLQNVAPTQDVRGSPADALNSAGPRTIGGMIDRIRTVSREPNRLQPSLLAQERRLRRRGRGPALRAALARRPRAPHLPARWGVRKPRPRRRIVRTPATASRPLSRRYAIEQARVLTRRPRSWSG